MNVKRLVMMAAAVAAMECWRFTPVALAQPAPSAPPASAPVPARPSTAPAASPFTLARAIQMALRRDERPRIAERQLASFEAQVDRARAFFFPDVALSGQYNFRGDPGMFQERHVLTGSVTASLVLFDGRGIPLYRAASLARSAAALDRDESVRQVAFEAAGAYLTTLGLQAVVEAAQHRVAFARATLADARGRVSAQLASSNDVTRADVELGTAVRELRRAQGDLDSGMLNLGWLIGAELRAPLASPDDLLAEAARPGARRLAVSEAQARRLDVRSGRIRVEAARQRALEPLWRWTPALGLIGQGSTSSVEDQTGRQTDWFLGVTAAWTLWDGGERGADRDDLVAQAEAAALQSDRQTRQVALEVQTATSALSSARETATVAESAVIAARKNVEETRTLYRQGLARALEVADATASLFDAEVALARERYGLGLALLDLRAALGVDPLERGERGAEAQ
ncbi:MAG TPA: TolC family protein [Kofleriaceae bacterium]|nr:TolC family protein [Kofleriaceae bacterium]